MRLDEKHLRALFFTGLCSSQQYLERSEDYGTINRQEHNFLRRARSSTMPLDSNMFVCSCQAMILDKDGVSAHDEGWFKLGHSLDCQYPGCGKLSPQTSNAKRHWRTHLPDRLRKHFCRRCGTGYVKQEHLKKHEAADTCLYNRQPQPCRGVDEIEENPPISNPPNALPNDRPAIPASAVEPELTVSWNLTNETSLRSPFALGESSYPAHDHLGYFNFHDQSICEWVDFTLADLDCVADVRPTWPQPPTRPGPGTSGWCSVYSPPTRLPRERDLSDEPATMPQSCHTRRYSAYQRHSGLPDSQPRYTPATHVHDAPHMAQGSSLFCRNTEEDLPQATLTLCSLTDTRNQGWVKLMRTHLKEKVDQMIAKIKGPFRENKPKVLPASTTESEVNSTALSLPFRPKTPGSQAMTRSAA